MHAIHRQQSSLKYIAKVSHMAPGVPKVSNIKFIVHCKHKSSIQYRVHCSLQAQKFNPIMSPENPPPSLPGRVVVRQTRIPQTRR